MPLRLVRPIGWIGGQIENVEADRGDFRQARDAIVEGAVLAGNAALTARHHLVPGAGARAFAVGNKRDEMAAGEVGPSIALLHSCRQLVVQQHRRILRGGKFLRRRFDQPLRFAFARRQLREQFVALARFRGNILAGFLLEQELPAPGREVIGPGFDGKKVPARLARRETATPAIVAVMLHWLALPIGARVRPPQQCRRDDVMTVAKYIGPYLD